MVCDYFKLPIFLILMNNKNISVELGFYMTHFCTY